ncbi:RES family NAD+ phosphorylase [Demequina capsici]|uniref:RES family NAD+ phosphorylase n=1 Tax=Demequina capsici TaxID=3075620 RepID=A0AA96J9K1_9MICO|nr:RES family NAD+ phosphorylase [Demequina sp. PMTSA13]WNM27357.1 RES family NAD+ phosphorylase [Demequina sp. PMTSA13]
MKVPQKPGALSFEPADLMTYDGPLWRIVRTTGLYTHAWNDGRAWGPLPAMRWDPHHPPASGQPDRAVLYMATTVKAAVAEAWARKRRIDVRTGSPIVVRATPAQPLDLLDLTGDWPIRNGGGASLPHAPLPVCRTWARAILDARPDLDGLYSSSTMTGVNVTLFPAGIAKLPSSPDMAAPAIDVKVRALLEAIASEIGYVSDARPAPGPSGQ